MDENQSKKLGVSHSAFSWVLSAEDLKNQTDNYDTLGITQSYRGVAAMLTAGLIALSFIVGLFGVISIDVGTVIEWLIYLVSLYFVYRGHRWAIILVMILWTADKAYQLYDSSASGHGNLIGIIIWWLIVMPYLYKALKVENERRKKLRPVLRQTGPSLGKFYCIHCGSQQDADAKFCTSCGQQSAKAK